MGHGRCRTTTDRDRRDGNRVTTIARDQLLDAACEATGLDDFGDVPFLEALDVLVDSFNHDVDLVERRGQRRRRDAHRSARQAAPPRRRPHAVPRDRGGAVTAPVFIVGQPRSGSTHLHALLACVEGVRAPRSWEMSAPSPPPERETYDTDPRIATVQAAIDQMPRGDAGATPDVGDPTRAVQRPVRLDLHQPGVDGVLRHPFVPRLVPRRRLHAHVRGASPHAAAPAVAATPADGCSSTRSTCCRSTRCSPSIPTRC